MKNRSAARRAHFQLANRIAAETLSPVAVMTAMPVPPVPAVVRMPSAPVMVMVPPAPVAMVMPAPMMVMPVPAYLGGHLLPGILLHRRRSARIDQRYCLCALEWSRDHKQRTNSRKTQNSLSDHSISSTDAIHASAVRLTTGSSLDATQMESWGR